MLKWKRWLFPFRYKHDFKMIHPGLRTSRMKMPVCAMIVDAIKTYSIWMKVVSKKKKPHVVAQGNPSKINTTFDRSSLKDRTSIYGIRSDRKDK